MHGLTAIIPYLPASAELAEKPDHEKSIPACLDSFLTFLPPPRPRISSAIQDHPGNHGHGYEKHFYGICKGYA